MKLIEIVNARGALQKLVVQDLPLRTAFRVVEVVEKCNRHLRFFSQERQKLGAIPDEARERYGDKLPASGGLYISAVSEGSDAAAKGLRAGDIILKVDGVEVSATAEISAMKEELSVGDTMTFTIWREGEILEFTVALVDTNDIYGK